MPEEPKILHVIDGIAEYDNDPPTWLLNIFYGSVIFSIVYWVLFPSWFGPGLLKWSQITKYQRELEAAQSLAVANAPAGGSAGDLSAMIGKPEAIEAGKAVFAQNCAACHGANAEGGIGPNLHQPPYWAYGKGEPADLEYIIANGTNDKAKMNPESKGGMPAWGSTLGKTKVQQTVAYVYSLQHPGN